MFFLFHVCAGVYVAVEGGWTKSDVSGEARMRLTKFSGKAKDPKLAGVEEPKLTQAITMNKNSPGLNLGLGYRWQKAQYHIALELGCRYQNLVHVASVPDMQKFEELDIHQIFADAKDKIEPEDRDDPRDAQLAQESAAYRDLSTQMWLIHRDLFGQSEPLYTLHQKKIAPYASFLVSYGRKVLPFIGLDLTCSSFGLRYREASFPTRHSLGVNLLIGAQVFCNKRLALRLSVSVPLWSQRMDFGLQEITPVNNKKDFLLHPHTKMQPLGFKVKHTTLRLGLVYHI